MKIFGDSWHTTNQFEKVESSFANASIIRQKGKFENGGNKKTKQAKFFEWLLSDLTNANQLGVIH